MAIKIYQVDAFADRLFAGNPAAVCPLDTWLPDKVMLNIAMENNLAETAFYVKEKEGFRIRWFTPAVEVDLCGHATLASAFVLFNFEGYTGTTLVFNSRSGPLTVTRNGELITLDFPADSISKTDLTSEMKDAFSIAPLAAFRGRTDYMLLYKSEDEIRKLVPDFALIKNLEARGVIVTAPGNKVDFVSRFFAPQSGIDEDPVTGSAHTTLIPFWSSELGKQNLEALQLSARGGALTCRMKENRVEISGKAKAFFKGTLFLDSAIESKTEQSLL